MGYGIKYSTSNVSNTLRKGNVVTTAAHSADPSENFHAGIPIVDGKHNIVKVHSTNDPDFYSLTDEELLNLVNSLGGNVESWLAAKNWINTQSDMFYLNNTIRSNIVTDGLVLDLNSKVNASFVNNIPTTNVLNNNINYGGQGAFLGTDAFGDYIQLAVANSSYSRFNLPNIPVSSGETYTWSFELYATETFTSGFSWDTNEYSDQYPSSNDLSRLSYSASTPSTITAGEWTPFALTVTMKSGLTGAYTYDFFRFFYPTFQGKRIYYRNMQFEHNTSVATPYAGQGATRTQNTTWYDLSGNGNNTSISSADYNSEGKYFQSVGDAPGSLIFSTPDSTTISNTFSVTSGGWTIEELIRVDDTTYPEAAAGTVVSEKAYGSTHTGFDWNHGVMSGTSLNIDMSNKNTGGGASRDAEVNLSIDSDLQTYGKWILRSIYWDRTNDKCGVYYNGRFQDSGSISGVSGYSLYDGAGISWGTLYGWHHDGARSFMRVYNRLLSESEVLQNYYGGPIVTDDLHLAWDAGNLVSYESGSTTTYSMTGSLNGTLTNGVNFTSFNGGSFIFDGSDDYISLGQSNNVGYNQTTTSWEVWIKSSDNGSSSDDWATFMGCRYGNSMQIGRYSGTSNLGILAATNNTGTGSGNNINLSNTNVTVFDEEWHHCVVTFDTGVFKVYVDGELVQTDSQRSGELLTTSNDVFGIGGSPQSSRYFGGDIAIARIYNKTLTIGEVQQNYIAHKSRFSS